MKRVLGILMAIILFAGMINIPMDVHAADPTMDGHGLMGEFFKMKPSGDRNDISIFDFDEAKFKGAKMVGNLNGDGFLGIFNQFSGTGDYNTARFTGTIVPEFTEDYTFHMEGDDGFRLWVDGKMILDFWELKYEIPKSSEIISLEAGVPYEIEIEYLQGWGGAWLRLEWESANQNREVVPESALYPSFKRIIQNKKFDVKAELQKINYLTENFADKVTESVLNNFKEIQRVAEDLLATIDDKEVSEQEKVDELTVAVEPLSIARAEFMKEMGVTSSSVSEKFNNPLYQGQDPFVAYQDGFYYYVSSSNLDSNNKVYVSKSRTLTDQGEKVMVFDSQGTQTRIFAPEIFFLQGKWYIYYCADVDEYGYRHMPVVLEGVTDDPQGEYVYKGVLYAGENGEYKQANDFTVFEYNEEIYAIWGTLGSGEPIGPAIVKMDNPYTITNDRSFLNKVGGGEGPRVLQKDGKVFVTMSEGDYQSDGYRLSYFMNTDGDFLNEDSWTRTDDVFVSTRDVSGPARAGFVKSADGKEDWMIYHSRVYKGTERNSWRQVNIKKFDWNEDGTPNFGSPVSPGEWQSYPSGDLGQGDMYQAEDAIHYGGITKGATAKGYQGTGYINLPNKSGTEASFVVDAEEGGDYIIGVRYAYGVKVGGEYTDNSKVQLPGRAKINVFVNGIYVKTIAPDKTEINWDEWFTASERLELIAGANVISYRIDNDSIGNVNLDHLTMYKADVPNSSDGNQVNKTALETTITLAIDEAAKIDVYSAESIALLNAEIVIAQAVLDNNNATQDDVDTAVTALNELLELLVVITPNPPVTADLQNIVISGYAANYTFEGGTYTYNGITVENGVTSITVTPTGSGTITIDGTVVVSGTASEAIALTAGTERIITIVVTEAGNSKTYMIKVTRNKSGDSGSGSGSSSGSGSNNGGGLTNSIITSTNGKLTLPSGKTGKVSLGEEVTISIPANATNKELKLTIEKLLEIQNLLSDQDVLASPVFEIMKNFSENFSKPVTLTFAFNPSALKDNQRAVVFYFDEMKKEWVEIGGKINGHYITIETNHFTKYAVFAVGQAPDVSTGTGPEINLSDISGHWAEANIKKAIENGIVTGYPDGTFNPGAAVTRAEFTVMLINTLKLQETGAELTFTDTTKIGNWAKKEVAQAVKTGIIKGYADGSFRPDMTITRTEMATMVANVLGLSKEMDAVTGFADDKDIPLWAKGAAAELKKLGLIEGRATNKFVPNGNTTRAEAVTVLLKLLMQ
ncbi:S-layer homology domain-containing protein [Paenibacillus sp. FA6]|uniref:S-layer homology domain-containing protein n=1 Tax=Paenibacillus sp. FA6 TaxID=3413029 RepID=UPI003F655D98